MSAQFNSKHGLISRSPEELYMSFTDLGNFARMAPAEYRDKITADYDTLTATVQGFTIGVKVTNRVPYSLIEIEDNDAPFHFKVGIHFDRASEPGKTDFFLEAEANLNLMMKAMLGGKIKEGLDKLVDGLAMASNGQMPDLTKDLNF